MSSDLPSGLLDALDVVQMPRSPHHIDKFVVGQHFTDEMKYHQVLLEIDAKLNAVRLGELDIEEKGIEIDDAAEPGRKGEIKRERLRIHQDMIRRGVIGAQRELEHLIAMWETFPVKYTREQLDSGIAHENETKLRYQAMLEFEATGRIGQGNRDALRQIGVWAEVGATETGSPCVQFLTALPKALIADQA
jgi:hypothetical protein